MKKFLKDILFFSLILGIIIFSILGSSAVNSYVVPVGNLQFAALDSGLSLYQLYKGSYYTFSPLNDYTTDGNSKVTLISSQDADTKSYKTDTNNYPWNGIVYSLEKFAGIYNPEITFDGKNKIVYKTRVSGNNLTVTRATTLRNNSGTKTLGATISFEPNDIVFDKAGNLLSLIDQGTTDEFTKQTGVTLTSQLNTTEINLSDKVIYIASHNIPAVIAVYASGNQTIKVDWDARLIEIEEPTAPKNGIYTNTVNIKILSSLKEAMNGN